MKHYTNYLLVLFFIFCTCSVYAQKIDVFVNGYLRKDGSYVQPHFRTSPNTSLFDNFSTIGNYNPYTGKPGWVDPYLKISSSSYSNITELSTSIYNDLFIYLNKKDITNYYKIINKLDYRYNLFFDGLFKINNGNIKDANDIFNTLKKTAKQEDFIYTESKYWADISSRYLDASEQFAFLSKSVENYKQDNRYDILFENINRINNPLIYYDKYLVKLIYKAQQHSYRETILAYDSLILYTTEADKRDTMISNYQDLVNYFTRKQDFITTKQNDTYYYDFELLYSNFYSLLTTNKIPVNDLSIACFKLDKENSSTTETSFSRFLVDTAQTDALKSDIITFKVTTFKKVPDTLFTISLTFLDRTQFDYYQNYLSKYLVRSSLENSLSFKVDNSTGVETGFECLRNESFVVGLKQKEINNKSELGYSLYIYCMKYNNNLRNLSKRFK